MSKYYLKSTLFGSQRSVLVIGYLVLVFLYDFLIPIAVDDPFFVKTKALQLIDNTQMPLIRALRYFTVLIV